VGVIDVMLLIRAGRLDDAEAAAQACYELGTAVGEVDTLGYLSTQMLGIRWSQGRDTELLEAAEEVAASPTLIRAEFALRASAAAISARAGQRALARAALDRLAADGLDALPLSSTWAPGMVAIVEVAAELGDGAVARQAYELLLPYADRPVIASVAVMCLGSTHRSLGIAALTVGDHDRAVDHLERAVDTNAHLGNRPLAAIARADLATALAARGLDDDRDRAVRQLERAIAEATDMGLDARADAWRLQLAGLGSTVRRGELRRDGAGWIVTLGGRGARVGGLVGMTYLADLLAHPRRSVAALDIAGRGEAPPSPGRHDVLDDRARAEYRSRVSELGDDLAEAEACHDEVRAERLQAELDALLDELEAATGLNGRSRAFADDAERARTAVRKAIKRAVDAIDATDPTIAALLRTTVTTGATCTYTPDRTSPVEWTVH